MSASRQSKIKRPQLATDVYPWAREFGTTCRTWNLVGSVQDPPGPDDYTRFPPEWTAATQHTQMPAGKLRDLPTEFIPDSDLYATTEITVPARRQPTIRRPVMRRPDMPRPAAASCEQQPISSSLTTMVPSASSSRIEDDDVEANVEKALAMAFPDTDPDAKSSEQKGTRQATAINTNDTATSKQHDINDSLPPPISRSQGESNRATDNNTTPSSSSRAPSDALPSRKPRPQADAEPRNGGPAAPSNGPTASSYTAATTNSSPPSPPAPNRWYIRMLACFGSPSCSEIDWSEGLGLHARICDYQREWL